MSALLWPGGLCLAVLALVLGYPSSPAPCLYPLYYVLLLVPYRIVPYLY